MSQSRASFFGAVAMAALSALVMVQVHASIYLGRHATAAPDFAQLGATARTGAVIVGPICVAEDDLGCTFAPGGWESCVTADGSSYVATMLDGSRSWSGPIDDRSLVVEGAMVCH